MNNYQITWLFILMFSVFSCKTQPEEKDQAQDKTVSVSVTSEVLTSELFQAKINEIDKVQLVDVRTPEEVADGMIEGAQNINIFDPTFKETITNLDKTKPIMVYCKSGGRSGKAAKILKELGFTEIYDLQGGFLGWKSNNLPFITP